jgi:hypothetical protein
VFNSENKIRGYIMQVEMNSAAAAARSISKLSSTRLSKKRERERK